MAPKSDEDPLSGLTIACNDTPILVKSGRQTTLISNSRLEVGVEGRIFGEDPRGSSAHNSLRGKCTADRCLQLNPLTVTVNTTVLEGGSRRNRMVLCFYKFVSGLE